MTDHAISVKRQCSTQPTLYQLLDQELHELPLSITWSTSPSSGSSCDRASCAMGIRCSGGMSTAKKTAPAEAVSTSAKTEMPSLPGLKTTT